MADETQSENSEIQSNEVNRIMWTDCNVLSSSKDKNEWRVKFSPQIRKYITSVRGGYGQFGDYKVDDNGEDTDELVIPFEEWIAKSVKWKKFDEVVQFVDRTVHRMHQFSELYTSNDYKTDAEMSDHCMVIPKKKKKKKHGRSRDIGSNDPNNATSNPYTALQTNFRNGLVIFMTMKTIIFASNQDIANYNFYDDDFEIDEWIGYLYLAIECIDGGSVSLNIQSNYVEENIVSELSYGVPMYAQIEKQNEIKYFVLHVADTTITAPKVSVTPTLLTINTPINDELSADNTFAIFDFVVNINNINIDASAHLLQDFYFIANALSGKIGLFVNAPDKYPQIPTTAANSSYFSADLQYAFQMIYIDHQDLEKITNSKQTKSRYIYRCVVGLIDTQSNARFSIVVNQESGKTATQYISDGIPMTYILSAKQKQLFKYELSDIDAGDELIFTITLSTIFGDPSTQFTWIKNLEKCDGIIPSSSTINVYTNCKRSFNLLCEFAYKIIFLFYFLFYI